MVAPLGKEQGALAAQEARDAERAEAARQGQLVGRASKHGDHAYVAEQRRYFRRWLDTVPDHARRDTELAFEDAYRAAARGIRSVSGNGTW